MSYCPICASPGWGPIDIVTGIPCDWCATLVDGYGDDPRGWAGFETLCQVYEVWVTAWALSQPDPDSVAEGVVRADTLSGHGGRPWQLR